jgi:hypothetical protein
LAKHPNYHRKFRRAIVPRRLQHVLPGPGSWRAQQRRFVGSPHPASGRSPAPAPRCAWAALAQTPPQSSIFRRRRKCSGLCWTWLPSDFWPSCRRFSSFVGRQLWQPSFLVVGLRDSAGSAQRRCSQSVHIRGVRRSSSLGLGQAGHSIRRNRHTATMRVSQLRPPVARREGLIGLVITQQRLATAT